MKRRAFMTIIDNASTQRLIQLALLCSLAFSTFLILRNPVLNDDAFRYLRAAEHVQSDGASAMLQVYGWYGYSILIALLAKILPVSLLTAAHLLNTLSQVLITWCFISIAREYRDTNRVVLFASLLILGFPVLNEMRHILIRDHAYWGFALLSLLHLLRFKRNGSWRSASYCGIALLLASCFRLEGFFLAAMSPLALLSGSTPRTEKLALISKMFSLLALGALLLFIIAWMINIDLPGLIQYAYRYYLPLIYNLGSLLHGNADAAAAVLFTADNFPGTTSSHNLIIVLLSYCYVVLINLANTLSTPLTLLLFWGLAGARIRLPEHVRGPILIYLGSALISLLVFQLIMHFQTQRYATFAALLLLSMFPAWLDRWYSSLARVVDEKRFAFWLVFACVYFFTDSLISFGHSRAHIVEAAKFSSTLPANSTLVTNEYQVAYNSGLIADYDLIPLQADEALATAEAGDYIALRIKKSEQVTRDLLDSDSSLESIRVFNNGKQDEVRFYRKVTP